MATSTLPNSRSLLIAAAVATASVWSGQASADAALAPHRAIYELKLREARNSTNVDRIRGRIVYEFTGDACEGYALSFRQVTEIGNGEGETNVSDLRAATWEDGQAQSFRFTAQNYLNQVLDKDTDGRAERADAALNVALSKPNKDSKTFDGRTLFPTEHLKSIISAAEKGETLLEAPVYDGSENGDKSYDTLTVIGKQEQGEPAGIEEAAKTPELQKAKRWPVSVSYFERGKRDANGEQTPVYAMSFDLYDNGVSRAMKIDYGDFVLDGELKELKFLKASACK
ncbi:cell envelope integrity EipB family protein [Methylopila henanensis]|uniref:Cell envelope integrity EipB family protein n=1 Tax=Methylopila henanensis TaxID=873516 RepID=A0ABW4K3P2_9HYPH